MSSKNFWSCSKHLIMKTMRYSCILTKRLRFLLYSWNDLNNRFQRLIFIWRRARKSAGADAICSNANFRCSRLRAPLVRSTTITCFPARTCRFWVINGSMSFLKKTRAGNSSSTNRSKSRKSGKEFRSGMLFRTFRHIVRSKALRWNWWFVLIASLSEPWPRLWSLIFLKIQDSSSGLVHNGSVWTILPWNAFWKKKKALWKFSSMPS